MSKSALAIVVLALLAITGCLFMALGDFETPATFPAFANHAESVATIVQLIETGETSEAMNLLDSLHDATIALRADLQGLRFEGSNDNLSDPVDVPAGTYRAHFATSGYGAVIPLDMEGETIGWGALFNVAQGGATDGASAVFNAPGGRIMFEFSNISAPYSFGLERIN